MKTKVKSHPCGNTSIREGACALETLGFLGGKRRFPWALTPGLGWGRVEVPPDSHVGIP